MALTIEEIYKQHNNIEFVRNIYIKRHLKKINYDNIVDNPNFDTDLSHWSSYNCNISLAPLGYEGNCMHVSGPHPYAPGDPVVRVIQNKNIVLPNNRDFQYSFYGAWYDRYTAPNITCYSEENQLGLSANPQILGAATFIRGQWTKANYVLRFDGYVPFITKSIKIEFIFYVHDPVNHPVNFYIDNISFTELDNYETDWVNIRNLISYNIDIDKNITISKTTPNDSYAFGHVSIDDITMNFLNKNGELSDETNINSIFSDGFTRHLSMIKLEEGYIDKYTDPDNSTEVTENIYYGIIDDTLCETLTNFTEKIVANEFLNWILNRYTLSDLYAHAEGSNGEQIVSRIASDYLISHFTLVADGTWGNVVTNFGYSPSYITAGNGYNLDLYDWNTTKLITVFQDVCFGHSMFRYLNHSSPPALPLMKITVDPIEAKGSTAFIFNSFPERKIKINKIMAGSKAVFNKITYTDGNYVSKALDTVINNYYSFSLTLLSNSEGDANQAINIQDLVDHILSLTKVKRRQIEIDTVFLPTLKLLDRIQIKVKGIESDTGEVYSPFIVYEGTQWFIKSIKHTDNLKTTLTLVETLEWILDTGFWVDTSYWIDTNKYWND